MGWNLTCFPLFKNFKEVSIVSIDISVLERNPSVYWKNLVHFIHLMLSKTVISIEATNDFIVSYHILFLITHTLNLIILFIQSLFRYRKGLSVNYIDTLALLKLLFLGLWLNWVLLLRFANFNDLLLLLQRLLLLIDWNLLVFIGDYIYFLWLMNVSLVAWVRWLDYSCRFGGFAFIAI